jgi:hypothetical protein
MATPLRLEPRATHVGDGPAMKPGYAVLAAQCFADGRVTALGIEHAIEHVEEAIMAAGPLPGAGGPLALQDLAVASLFDTIAPDRSALDLDTVERAFSALADHAQGSAVAGRLLPTDIASAARLVWLRELLHHGRYSGLSLG